MPFWGSQKQGCHKSQTGNISEVKKQSHNKTFLKNSEWIKYRNEEIWIFLVRITNWASEIIFEVT